MTEQPLNLVLEQLRHIRATTDKTSTKVLELEKHLIELRLQVAGLAVKTPPSMQGSPIMRRALSGSSLA
jgi:hypothetical protein